MGPVRIPEDRRVSGFLRSARVVARRYPQAHLHEVSVFVPATLTANALAVLHERYLARDEQGRVAETPDQMFRRVAAAVAAAEGPDAAVWAERFYRRMAALEFLPNSPTLMNGGRPLGQLAACFVVPVGDSMPEIFDALNGASIIPMNGGGTGRCIRSTYELPIGSMRWRF